MVVTNSLQTSIQMVLFLTSTSLHMRLINFDKLHKLPQMFQYFLCQLCVVHHFLNMGQILQSMHFQHSFQLVEVVLMNQENTKSLRKIGQIIFFSFVVVDLLDIHDFDTGHSTPFCNMKQRKLQSGIKVSSRAKILSQQYR